MKVTLLNGAHTVTVFPALLSGLETVGECMSDSEIFPFLKHYLYDCALPTLSHSKENKAFAEAVLERFKNPFIKHQLKSIALNSVSKFSVRVLAAAEEYKSRFGAYPRVVAVSLAALIYYYKSYDPSDGEKNISFIRESNLEEIISSPLFGYDITPMKSEFEKAYEMIENGKIREAVKWATL